MDTQVLATADDMAVRMQLQPETIRQMAREGRLPARKVGRVWRFDPLEVDAATGGPRLDTDARPATSVSDDVLPLYDASSEPSAEVSFRDPAFSENRSEPVHRWVPWIAGFSSDFVRTCLDKYLEWRPYPAVVLDPFAGVGTTLVVAAQRGLDTVGFEINPYAALAARAKLEACSVPPDIFRTWIRVFRCWMQESEGSEPDNALVPPRFRSRIAFFSPSVKRQVLHALKFISGLGDPAIRDLFTIAFGSVMVRFSNYSYEPSLASRPACGKPLIDSADVTAVVELKLREMLADVTACARTANCPTNGRRREVIEDTCFNASTHLASGCVDLAITSPPYLNNYHYVRNTRPHIHWLRLAESDGGLRAIEHGSFGKFWQTVRDREPMSLDFAEPEIEALLADLRSRNLEKGLYGGPGWANYAAQYFNDTSRFYSVMSEVLRPGGRMVVVIGNSVLQGLEVRVDHFMSRIGQQHGFACEARHMLRTKRVGNSIIRSSVRTSAGSDVSLYEVALVMRRA